MSIKGKLIFMLSVMGAILAFLAGFVVWNTRQISRQVAIVGPGVDYLREAGDIRLRLYRQMHALIHYQIFHEERAKSEFQEYRLEILGLFRDLAETLRKASAPQTKAGPGAPEAVQHADGHVRKIEDSYRAILQEVERSFELNRPGKPLAARRLLGDRVQPLIDDVFLKEIDEAIHDKVDEIMSAYDTMLLRLGAMPWTGKESIRQIQGTRQSIQYNLAVDRLSLSVNRELSAIFDYVVTGDARYTLQFEIAGIDVERALRECKTLVQTQLTLGMAGEEEQLKDLLDMERGYREMSETMRRIYEIKAAGRTEAALSLAKRRLNPLSKNSVLPKLDRIMVNSRAEIALDHRILLRSIYTTGIVGVSVITTVALVLFLLTYQIIRRMLESIHRLNSGADLIGRGNLDHSIAVDTGDELGGLAVSFNRMTMSLKDGNEDLRSFIYSLSHDLRSPLVNIKGFSGELAHVLKDLAAVLDRASERLTPEDRLRLEAMLQNDIPAALGFIGGAAERINELVNAVRKLSLVGQMDLRQETLDMDSIVRACLGRFSEEIARKNITVTVGGLPPVAADKAAMEEIVGNLLDNALKYLSPGRPGRVDITGTRNGKEILFQVRDNGRGIAKDDLAKIFGLFRRAGDQDIPGDGMGLTYVKALVRRHGGRIWCESEEGAGTTFSFAVPGGAAQGG